MYRFELRTARRAVCMLEVCVVQVLFHYQYHRYYLWSVCYTVISLSILSLLSVECVLHCYFLINIIVIICGVCVTRTIDRVQF